MLRNQYKNFTYKVLFAVTIFGLVATLIICAFVDHNTINATLKQATLASAVKLQSNNHILNDNQLQNQLNQLKAFVVGDPPSLQDINDCKTSTVTSTGAFCVTKDKLYIGGNEQWSKDLAQDLCDMFRNKTVLDLGAGLGHYTRYLRENNCASFVLGYDGGVGVFEATQGLVQRADLTKNHDFGQFDYVLSLEVAEHIPKQYEPAFLKNVHKHNKHGVVLSWAIVGQGGHSHVNTQNAEYVVNKMRNFGYRYDKDKSLKMRSNVHDCCPWFRNTVYVFRR